jgi:hypothetical protein
MRALMSMVVANRPWRLVLGLRNALAAVLATSAYLVITSTIWQLALALSVTKLSITMVAAVVMMVVWMVATHQLWRDRTDASSREEAWLLNASTVLTLLLGVLTMAAAVLVFNILTTVFFLEPPVFYSDAGTGQGFADHVRLAWLATAFATVAGALGSGLDSDAAVEAATYSEEERQQRREAEAEGDAQAEQSSSGRSSDED